MTQQYKARRFRNFLKIPSWVFLHFLEPVRSVGCCAI